MRRRKVERREKKRAEKERRREEKRAEKARRKEEPVEQQHEEGRPREEG